MSRRDWGNVRQLKSGRWQARYRGPDGIMRPAADTFERKKDATDWLSRMRTEIRQGDWINPDVANVDLKTYGERWIRERTLADTTRERYESLFKNHIEPKLGRVLVPDVRDATVRTLYSGLLAAGMSKSTAAKVYRLLHAIFETAQRDQLVRRNPCSIKGASSDDSAERTVLTVDEVFRIAGAIQPRYRVLILLAAFTSLRFGELAALRRRNINLDHNDVQVIRSQAELRGGKRVLKEPKSKAGTRVVAIPSDVADELRTHLEQFADPGLDSPVFVGPQGGTLRRHNFRRLWLAALKESKIDRDDVHFHDLRHTGNDLAAKAGASTRELMVRMGHSSVRAALIYQHGSRDRDREIAERMNRDLAHKRPRPRPTQQELWHVDGTPAEETG